MELIKFVYHPLLFILPLLLLFLFRYIRTGSRKPSGRLPPGPWELPVLGGIHHLLGSSQLTHRALQKLAQKHGPIMHMRLGEVPNIIISSAEIAREVFKKHDITFSDRSQTLSLNILTYGCKDIIFSNYGEHWRQLRKISVLELFSSKRIQSFQYIREEEVLNLVREIYSTNGSSINLSKVLSSLTYNITTRSVMGNRRNKRQKEYLQLVAEINELTGGFSLADLFPSLPLVALITGMKARLLRCQRKVDQILAGIIEEHKQRRMECIKSGAPLEEDVIDVLLKIQEEGGSDDRFHLSEDCIKALVFDIFGAGSETSATTMEWAMTELVKNPKVMEKVQSEVREMMSGKENMSEDDVRELNYLNLVIKEVLRLHMPAPLLIPRVCRETCEVLGYEIPAKARVVVNAGAIGRDPHYWDDAEEFKPERFDGSLIDFKGANFEYLPFGVGRRICPGMSSGLATMELALAQLLYHFDWKLPDGGNPCDLDVEEGFGVTVHKKTNLVLCTTPRMSCPATA